MQHQQKHHQGGGSRDNQSGTPQIGQVKPEWLDEFSQETLTWAEETGKALQSGKVTTAQLRKFFGSVRRLEQEFFTEQDYKPIRQELLLMKPRLAYSAARASTVGESKADPKIFEGFVKQVSSLLDQVSKADDKSLKSRYKTFVHILEAIVAYHKLSGGK